MRLKTKVCIVSGFSKASCINRAVIEFSGDITV
jgi:hypothetical protein